MKKSIETKLSINREIKLNILKSIDLIVTAFENKNKLIICGNGGSAADSQHIAAEFVSKFLIDRKALFALALNCNTSSLTAISNDYNYDYSYSRQVEAFGTKNDILWGISTSGNSKNVLNAVEVAKSKGMSIIGMTGNQGGKLAALCDIAIRVPSDHTPNIQECHIMIAHIICEIVEARLFK
ncbi:D-sedoheptulose 7-phosphate isomerase [Fluviispira sanaruensis]|uniref:D-sedoheptulose 7-phosphate isomerase n=1 Tax=Fluviispira sanaruensis TaxID=2493639 RepID=UPI003CCC5481